MSTIPRNGVRLCLPRESSTKTIGCGSGLRVVSNKERCDAQVFLKGLSLCSVSDSSPTLTFSHQLSVSRQRIRVGSSWAQTGFHLTRQRSVAKRCPEWSLRWHGHCSRRGRFFSNSRDRKWQMWCSKFALSWPRQSMADWTCWTAPPQHCRESQQIQLQSLTESVTSFQEAGKAAPTRDSSDISGHTCTCGCKRGLAKERHCLSPVRAPTSSTSAPFRQIVHKRSSEQLKRRPTNYRTTANEPLRRVQQTQERRDFEAWRATSRRCDQRNMSEKNSAYAALIGNSSERDRAKDVLLIALENIIIDKVSRPPTIRQKEVGTSGSLEIGIAAKDASESLREEREQRIMDIALQAVYEGTGKGNWSAGKGPSWNVQRNTGGKGGEDAHRGGKSSWQEGIGKKGGQGTEKGGTGDSRTCCTCGKALRTGASC